MLQTWGGENLFKNLEYSLCITLTSAGGCEGSCPFDSKLIDPKHETSVPMSETVGANRSGEFESYSLVFCAWQWRWPCIGQSGSMIRLSTLSTWSDIAKASCVCPTKVTAFWGFSPYTSAWKKKAGNYIMPQSNIVNTRRKCTCDDVIQNGRWGLETSSAILNDVIGSPKSHNSHTYSEKDTPYFLFSTVSVGDLSPSVDKAGRVIAIYYTRDRQESLGKRVP